MAGGFNEFRKQVNKGISARRWSLKSITALVLFGAIIMVFVFFGFPSKLDQAGGGVGAVASVNRTLISYADLQSESNRMEQMYAPLFGGNISEAQRQDLRLRVLENLISQEVIYQVAQKEGVLATNEEVQDVIVNEVKAFQKNGRFQRDLYFGVLEANRLVPADFEEKIRKEKVTQRAQRLFEAVSIPSKIEVEKTLQLKNKKMNVQVAKVNKELIQAKYPVSVQELNSRISQAEFKTKIGEYYQANRPEFEIPAQVRAQHILIKIDDKRPESEAKSEIMKIAKESEKEDFGKLATKYSEDLGTKSKNGDLGFFETGKMDAKFEAASFSQEIGKVGEPVRSAYGYHLIKVNEKKPGGIKAIELVEAEIARKLIFNEKYEQEIKALEGALESSNVQLVDSILAKMGAKYEETGFFDLAADGAAHLESPEVFSQAIQLNSEKKIIPNLVREGSDRYVLKLKEIKVDSKSSESGKEVVAQIARERAMGSFNQWIKASQESLKIQRNYNPNMMR